MGCIYLATNTINGKQYVGQAQDIDKRKNGHKRDVRNGKGYVFHKALRKYGWDAFEWGVVFECQDKLLNRWERYYIKRLNTKSPNGYNLTDGGEGTRGHRWKATKDMVEQNRVRAVQHWSSKEAREKLSESLKRSVIHKASMGTSEYRNLQREITTARWKKPGYREQIVEATLGKKHKPPSVEGRRSMSLAHIGKQHTKEQRIKNSESHRRWWANPENKATACKEGRGMGNQNARGKHKRPMSLEGRNNIKLAMQRPDVQVKLRKRKKVLNGRSR